MLRTPGARSGALGSVAPGTMRPAWDEVAWRAPLMEVQGPVRTDDGYHLILVLSRRGEPAEALPAPPVNAAKKDS